MTEAIPQATGDRRHKKEQPDFKPNADKSEKTESGMGRAHTISLSPLLEHISATTGRVEPPKRLNDSWDLRLHNAKGLTSIGGVWTEMQAVPFPYHATEPLFGAYLRNHRSD